MGISTGKKARKAGGTRKSLRAKHTSYGKKQHRRRNTGGVVTLL